MALRAVKTSSGTPAENAAERLLPVATTALAALLSILPLRLPGYAAVTPAFLVMAAYHWTIYRPHLLPPFALFIIGATYDILTGGLLGVTSLSLLLARAVVLRYRRWFDDRAFAYVWSGFAVLTGGLILMLWMLHSVLELRLVDFRSSIFRAVLTISLFPVVSFVLGRTQRTLMNAG